MAHMIDNSKDFNAFVYSGAAPWHGLGEKMDAISAKDALIKGGLDFNVFKLPNIHLIPQENGGMVEIISTSSFFTFRDDTRAILGAKLGSDYTVMQNADALNLVDEILQTGSATIETAGAINDGKKVFICLKANTPIKVGDSDVVNQYVLIATSHDGSMSITATPTNVRVVCNNTLSAALAGAQGAIKIRHTSKANERLREAAKVLKLIHDNTAANEDAYNKMKATQLSTAGMYDYFSNLMLSADEIKAIKAGKNPAHVISTVKKNNLDKVLKFASGGIGQDIARVGDQNNMWSAYNAYTGYVSRKSYTSADDRANSLLFGAAAASIEKAGVLALEPQKIITMRASGLSGFNLN